MARVGQARPQLWLMSPASPLPPDTTSSPSISTHRPTSGGTLVTPPAEGTPSPALGYSPRWPGTFRSPRFRTSEPILTSSRAAKNLTTGTPSRTHGVRGVETPQPHSTVHYSRSLTVTTSS